MQETRASFWYQLFECVGHPIAYSSWTDMV